MASGTRRRGGGSNCWRERFRRKTPHRPEKLKRTGAVPSRQIASRRCCVRAARALLLGHRAVVAFWSVCCSVLRVWGRAQSVPARRAQFFAAVLRSLRQSCHRACVAFGARYRRALAPAFGAALSSGLAMRLVGRPAESSAGRGPRTPSAPLRAARVAGEAKMPPPRVGARPMTQTDAYRAGRGLILRLTDPRRRRSRAVLPERTSTKKGARPGAKRCNRDRCCAARAQ